MGIDRYRARHTWGYMDTDLLLVGRVTQDSKRIKTQQTQHVDKQHQLQTEPWSHHMIQQYCTLVLCIGWREWEWWGTYFFSNLPQLQVNNRNIIKYSAINV